MWIIYFVMDQLNYFQITNTITSYIKATTLRDIKLKIERLPQIKWIPNFPITPLERLNTL